MRAGCLALIDSLSATSPDQRARKTQGVNLYASAWGNANATPQILLYSSR